MPSSGLDVKRVDWVFDELMHVWKYEDTKIDMDAQILQGGKKLDGSDIWESFCFVIVRQIPPQHSPIEPTVIIVIKSPHLRRVCQNVIGDIPSFSWTIDPLKVCLLHQNVIFSIDVLTTNLQLSTELLIAFFPRFVAYRDELQMKPDRGDEEEDTLRAVQTLIDYMEQDHQVTISQIENLLAHEEMTYSLLYAILIPGTRLISTDSATGEPRALELRNAIASGCALELSCIGLDAIGPQNAGAGTDSDNLDLLGSPVSKVSMTIQLAPFQGVVKINALPIYPIRYHPDEAGLEKALLARAQKWMMFHGPGIHHVHYQGVAVSGPHNYMKYEASTPLTSWPCSCSDMI